MLRKGAQFALQAERAGLEQTCAAAQAAFTRQYGAPVPAGDKPTTPLSPIMPKVVTIPRQVVGTALELTGKAVAGAATSGYVKDLVTSFAEKAIVSEDYMKVEETDVVFWAKWLSIGGYSNLAGYKKFADAAKAKLPTLSPAQVTDLIVAFHKVGYYDKDLYAGIAANISANFTKYETEQLLPILSAFLEYGFYNQVAFDDIADSITYCNHYLAPIKSCPKQLASAFAVYAKYDHERGDFFTALARGFNEAALDALSEEDRKAVALKALRAFHAFQFWPEQADALLYAAKKSSLSGDEAAEVAKYQALVEDAAGGELRVFKEGDDVDSVHWYGHHTHGPSSYQMYVFRDALVPKQYSPAGMRPMK
ncbi:hypothetical protein HYH03_010725 [Edaphochlamys debaryana]|uniref:Uncharacterized protein n=1 Tax=Edaphochlamys debaryana TaxID=47281 RepID=A0A835XV74_9CHLO|nr:hypothetical protein HYH03_010725 [Edaphochlamys debaryana]|eukprot:KAG2490803.1 hypothetical protein HYH03_010725 [Edaphochlamys debaryana]